RARTGVPLQSLTTSSIGFQISATSFRLSVAGLAPLWPQATHRKTKAESVEGSDFWVDVYMGFIGSACLRTSRTGWKAGRAHYGPHQSTRREATMGTHAAEGQSLLPMAV